MFFIDTDSCCLQNVRDYVSREIGSQKMQLLSRLGIATGGSEVDCAEALRDIKWWRLSLELERLGKTDIVEHITKSTLITEGNKSFRVL